MKNQTLRALVVDDDRAVLSTLCRAMQTSGIDTVSSESGEEALRTLDNEKFDVILMDINMPGMDGFDAIKAIRGRAIGTPIIIVSGRGADLDTLYGLDVGADDYVTKPFNAVTLGAKAKALIRRSRAAGETVIHAGPFAYDTATLRFYKNGTEIPLTSKENAMMKLFIDNVNRIFTKNMLYDLIWDNAIIDEQAIMVYVNRLRRKIEDDPAEPRYIRTVRGLGYTFVV